MADAFKSSKGGAQSRRGVDRVTLQATLADLARAAGDDSTSGTDGADGAPDSDAMVGSTGHRALAALAAEVSQASALADPASDARPAAADDVPAPAPRLSPVAAALRTTTPRKTPAPAAPSSSPGGPAPVSAGSLRPIGKADSDDVAAFDSLPGGPGVPGGDSASLPAPNRLVPGSVRLPTKPADTVAPDQPTIPLRRRAISDGPVSISPAPLARTAESSSGGAGPNPPAPAAVVRGASPTVVAWLPSDDDILPRRQMRRGRSFRRTR